MQTSLNPLITNIIKGDKLASTMTFGQFVKAIASFMAPYIAMWGATAAMPSFGLGWRVLFPVYGIIGILAALLLLLSNIEREQVADKASGFAECFKLLGKPIVLLSFLGIMCHVGIDVGTNTTAPKLLMERVGMTLMAKSWNDLKACFGDPGAHWPADGKEGILDSRAFYAAKTASDGTDRYIWGWCPYRIGSDIHEKNINVGADSEPAWSGALVCHKIIQHPDGTLTVGAVPALDAKYSQSKEVTILENGDGFTLYNRLGSHNHISFTATTEDKFGVSLVRGSDSKKYYTMVVNPEDGGANRKINFEQEGEEGKGFIEGVDGYKFASPADKKYKVDIYTDNSVVVVLPQRRFHIRKPQLELRPHRPRHQQCD